MSELRFLIVDDDVAVGVVLHGLLSQMDVESTVVQGATDALDVLSRGHFDCVITDLRMPGMDGLELLTRIASNSPDLPVVVLSAHGTIPVAVEAMKRGASDFLTKPFERDDLVRLVRKVEALQRRSSPPVHPELGLVGTSPPMEKLRGLIRKSARSAATVLIRGETGTGKELVARSIHRESDRADKPFVTMQCAALPESLLESELFGYEKGAFTGASTAKPGRVALAERGTLFLDEIGDVSVLVQLKLLRLLQEREYEALGGTKTIRTNVRFVAATNRSIEEDIRDGKFREDLFYRLNVVSIWVPPLRDRSTDIDLLVEHFRQAACSEHQKDITISDRALDALRQYDWPGNVRELRNVVERFVVLADTDVVDESVVDAELQQGMGNTLASQRRSTRPSATKDEILRVLQRSSNNRTLAARLLGMSRRTLYNRLAEFGLTE